MNNYHHKHLKYKYKYQNLKKYLQNRIGNDDGVGYNKLNYANNMLCMVIFNNLEGASNIISPILITFILSLLHLASEGRTDEELFKLFNYKYNIEELNYLYQMFLDNNFYVSNLFILNKNKIDKINMKYFREIDHMAKIVIKRFDKSGKLIKKINKYIEDNTNGIVQNIISAKEINRSAVMVIVTSIYFSSNWLHKFDINNTILIPFHKTNNIEMMHQINTFGYYENEKLQFVEMLYERTSYVMGIILPIFRDDNNLFQTPYNIPKLNMTDINDLVGNLKPTLLDIYIPKFVQQKNIDLIPILKKIGINELFNKSWANLNIIAKDLYISKIIHQAAIVINENGMDVQETSSLLNQNNLIEKIKPNQDAKIFKADHAFLYYIRYIPANIILFYGDYQGN